MNESNRRSYHINEETWKAVMENLNIEFKKDEVYEDYKYIDKISEVMHND